MEQNFNCSNKREKYSDCLFSKEKKSALFPVVMQSILYFYSIMLMVTARVNFQFRLQIHWRNQTCQQESNLYYHSLSELKTTCS